MPSSKINYNIKHLYKIMLCQKFTKVEQFKNYQETVTRIYTDIHSALYYRVVVNKYELYFN